MPEQELVRLRDHIERVLAEMDLRYQQRFEAQERAIAEAKRSSSAVLAFVVAAAGVLVGVIAVIVTLTR